MFATDQRDLRTPRKHTAVRTVVFYVIFASLWIYFSDTLLAWFLSDPDQLTQAQTFKNGFFVAVTATLLYLYLSHCLQVQRNCEEAIEEEQDKTQQDIRERFKQLSTLFDSMNAVVYVADFTTYELLYVNQFTEQFFGQDWRGRKCYQYLQEGINHPCDFCTNSQLIINGEPGNPVVWEFLNTKNNRWYECIDNAIRWTDGRLVRLEVAQDITERKELEKIKDDLLSTMSHEMRTPLTAISGFAELLLNEPEVPEQQRRHVEIIYNEAEKLTELINRFLDVRRLKFDRARINYEYLSVLDLMEKAKNGCRDCKAHHHIKIECQADIQVYGNRQELTQAITQLLENACRYSPESGRISLTAQSSNRETSICVADQGLGIPKHELESIFNPFHRIDTGNTRSTGGVGLGLCLAKEVVTLHGGKMQVESISGQGSTFTIVLPKPVDRNNTLNVNTNDARQL